MLAVVFVPLPPERKTPPLPARVSSNSIDKINTWYYNNITIFHGSTGCFSDATDGGGSGVGEERRIFIYLTKDGEAEVVWRVPSRSYSPGTAVVLAICVLMFTTVVSFRLLVSCLLHESSFRYH